MNNVINIIHTSKSKSLAHSHNCRKVASIFFVFSFLSLSLFAQGLPLGYGGVSLGMNFDSAIEAIKKNREFGYSGERDVSLLPGENRTLIETNSRLNHVVSFLDRCFFQFENDTLEVITINLNQEKIDHYSVFTTLCEKYGQPVSLSPSKSVWENDTVSMSLERPLTLKYMFIKTENMSEVQLSGEEMTRESFLDTL